MRPAPEGRPDWWDSAPYRALSGIDRAGLAWEWLRRDPGYAAMSARLRCIAGLAPYLETEADARAFGLCFRRGRRPACARSAPFVAR